MIADTSVWIAQLQQTDQRPLHLIHADDLPAIRLQALALALGCGWAPPLDSWPRREKAVFFLKIEAAGVPHHRMVATRPTHGLDMTDAPNLDATAGRQRLTIYTVLVGAKELLNDPLAEMSEASRAATDLALDFVCLTDDPALTSPTWRFEPLPPAHLPADKFSRRPKALPHVYFPDTEFSLYIDNTVTLRRLPQASDLATSQPYLLRTFRHPLRNALLPEADAVAFMCYDEVPNICRQLDFYASVTDLEAIAPLTTATVILRSHHDAVVRRFGELWWENLLAFSRRDQLSIDFARQRSGAVVDYWPETLDDNDFVRRYDGPAAVRVRASFDPVRYAWLHRDDPAAVRDPGAHFLAHGGGFDAAYQRPLRLLEYICNRQRSSLGHQVSPRRAMADALQAMLTELRGRSYLLVRVQDATVPRGFEAGELAAATQALGAFMGAGGAAFELDAATVRDATVYTAPAQRFDVLVVLGLAPELLAPVTQKLARLLTPGSGALVLALCSPAALAAVVQAEQLLADVLGAPVRTSLHGSQHDEEQGLVENTVLGFFAEPPAALV